jgi:MFS family permease
MKTSLGSFSALFLSTLLFIMGNGALGTFLGIRLTQAGHPATTTGMVMACYFFGLLSGSFLCRGLIQKVGHIRSFAAFAAGSTAAILIHGLYFDPYAWGLLRWITGICTIGIFMVIESWLNECTDPGSRGRVFSIYMVVTYLGIGAGQQFLNFSNGNGPEVFFICAILLTLSLVPITVTRSVHPKLSEPGTYNLILLIKRSPVGFLGCLTAGLINSAFYGLAPVFCTHIGLSVREVSGVMSATVLGGLSLQWGIGALSDRFDRTLLMPALGFLVALVCVIPLLYSNGGYFWLLFEMGLFGGLAFAIYPLSVARAHDRFKGKNIVSVSAGLLLSYSIGATLGPILASGCMAFLKNPHGLFFYWFIVSILFAFLILYLRYRELVKIVPVESQTAFIPMKNAAAVVTPLDPRVDLDAPKIH